MKSCSALLLTVCSLLTCLAAPSDISAQGLTPLIEGYSVLSRTDGAPVVKSVALAPPYVAAAFGARLAILDATTPSAPVQVASLDLPQSPLGFTLVGTRLFVADGARGLVILDVSNPLAPQFLGTFTTNPVSAVAVSPNGNYAYTCNGSTEIHVISLKDVNYPKEHTLISERKANISDMIVAGSYLICASGPRGIAVYTLANPRRPIKVARMKDLRGCRKIALQDRLLAVADDDAGLALVNFPTWDAPNLKGTLPLADLALDCAFLQSDPTKVILAQGSSGYCIADVSDANAPTLAYQAGSPQPAVALSTYGSGAYLDCGVAGLWQVDLSQLASPSARQVAQGSSGWYGIATNGDFAYIAGDSELQTWNLADPGHPLSLAAIPLPTPAVYLEVANGLLFASCQTSGVLIFSLATPSAPALIGTYPGEGGAANQTSVSGNLLAVAGGTDGAVLVDVTDPASPQKLSAYQAGDVGKAFAVGVAFSAANPNLLWVVNSVAGFVSLDVSNPSSPVVLGKIGLDADFGRVIDMPDYAVVVTGQAGGVQFVKTSTPDKPTKSSTLSGYQVLGMALSGTRFLLLDGPLGLKEYDVSDPAKPIQTAYFVAPGYTSAGGFLPGGQLVVTTKEGGLYTIAPASCAGDRLLLPCDGQSIPRSYAPLFSWQPESGAKYSLDLSVEPSFPKGDKKTRTTAIIEKDLSSWTAGSADWKWAVKRALEGNPIYWRVKYKANNAKTYSEVRSFDIQ